MEHNPKIRIGVLVIATGERYHQFILPLLESARKYFLPEHHRTFFLFTDSSKDFGSDVVKIKISSRGYPGETLFRYHTFTKDKDIYKDCDYLFYSDIDMRFVDIVGDEVLGDLVGTLHPGFYTKRGTYEEDSRSSAYVHGGEGKYYFCGGFNGGKRERYLKMAETIKENIDKDLKNRMVAVWHDESHINRYFIDHEPSVILSPSYCYPEPPTDERMEYSAITKFKPKLLALNK